MSKLNDEPPALGFLDAYKTTIVEPTAPVKATLVRAIAPNSGKQIGYIAVASHDQATGAR